MRIVFFFDECSAVLRIAVNYITEPLLAGERRSDVRRSNDPEQLPGFVKAGGDRSDAARQWDEDASR